METKKKTPWSLLNPLECLNAAFGVFAALFAPLLRWLGMLTPLRTDGFEKIQKTDVEDGKKLAEEQETAVDTITREMSPAEVVRAYARADAVRRAAASANVLAMVAVSCPSSNAAAPAEFRLVKIIIRSTSVTIGR